MKSQVLFFVFLLSISLHVRAAGSVGVNAIYGSDDRIDILDEKNPEIQVMKKSVALIISKDNVEKKLFHSLIRTDVLGESPNLCRDEKFVGQKSISGCTGFLIAPDIMISAGHCFMSESDCTDKIVLFDVTEKEQKEEGYRVTHFNTAFCKEIIDSSFSDEKDFAIIRLTKKSNRPTLKLRTKGSLKDNEQVFMLGHPLGTPLKKSEQVAVSDNTHPFFFKAPLDSFSGNSGSPVINARTLQVEGILVRGEEDFLLDENNKCYRNRIYDSTRAEDSLRGEGVTRISELLSSLPQ